MSLPKLANVPSEAPQVIRRSRGKINKRACEKCRQLKIRCDGDAQEGSVCSNCDKGSCVYDQSPRKNRQVEKLKTQVSDLESNLKQISKSFENQNFQLGVLRMEKKIMAQLINCQSYFYESQSTFNQLVQCIEESRCLSIFLPIIRDLLFLLISNENRTTIVGCLKTIAESTLRCCEPDSSLGNEYPEEWAKEILNFVTNNNLIVSMTNNTNTPNNLSAVNNTANTLSVPSNAITNLRIISRAVSPADSMSTIVSSSSPIVDGGGLEINNMNMLEFHNSQVPFVSSSSSFIQHNNPYFPINNINTNDSNNSNNSNNSSENVDYSSFLNLDSNAGNWPL
ncbi:hypothetical protein Glove_208g54 [Diversispora epigaea]|uniref:Zn(2)-C6 fungal-type domain-containing protein n=1 Tax=Diversispora epigaea TaxID=1348612 RepID=A0A397INV0_9GLOM|nr:hypothetical protein Glove_208g54 [Diversispora epigaea]